MGPGDAAHGLPRVQASYLLAANIDGTALTTLRAPAFGAGPQRAGTSRRSPRTVHRRR